MKAQDTRKACHVKARDTREAGHMKAQASVRSRATAAGVRVPSRGTYECVLELQQSCTHETGLEGALSPEAGFGWARRRERTCTPPSGGMFCFTSLYSGGSSG